MSGCVRLFATLLIPTTAQTVHGGLLLSLTDTLGSLAVASRGHFMTGLSTDVATSFVRPAGKTGDTLFAKATLTSLGTSSPCSAYRCWTSTGRQVAYTRVDFMNGNGELVAYGSKCPLLQKYPSFTPHSTHEIHRQVCIRPSACIHQCC